MRPYHVFMGGRPYNNHHNRHRHPHPHHFNSIATAHPRAHFQGEWEGEEGRGMSGSHGYPRPHTRSAGGRRGNHRPSHFGASPHLNHGDIDMSYEVHSFFWHFLVTAYDTFFFNVFIIFAIIMEYFSENCYTHHTCTHAQTCHTHIHTHTLVRVYNSLYWSWKMSRQVWMLIPSLDSPPPSDTLK